MSATLLLFADFETTGIDTTKDQLLEGYFELRAEDRANGIVCQPLGEFHFYLDTDYDRASLNPFVEEMHTKNGLWEDLLTASLVKTSFADTVLAAAVAQAKTDFGGATVHLAGMGVANYDKQMITRDMPELTRLLHYRCVDTSVIATAARIAGWEPHPDDAAVFGPVAHRAKGDVLQGIAQHLYFTERFQPVTV